MPSVTTKPARSSPRHRKTATAWAELNEAAVIGKGVGRNDLAAAAQKRAQAMEPTLSRLVVRMPRGEDTSSYDVKRDGEPVDVAQLGTAVAVDPGAHRIDVSAKGKVARSYAVRSSGAGVVEIVLDRLEDEPRAVAVIPPMKPAPIRLVAPEQLPSAEEKRGGTQRVLGIAVIGLGVVGIGTGAYFGGRALSQRAEGERACTTTPCPANANDANQRAKTSFATGITSIAAGTGAIALGTVIYLMAPSNGNASSSATPPRRTARITPEVSPTQVSMGVSGSFRINAMRPAISSLGDSPGSTSSRSTGKAMLCGRNTSRLDTKST